MTRLIVVGILFAVPVFAQPSFEVYSGLNWPHSPFSGITDIYLSDYWSLGLDVGLNADIRLATWIVLSPGFEYDRYPFGHYFEDVSTGEQSVQSSSGKSSSVYRFPVLLRLIDNSNDKMKPYFSVGGEYVLEDLGRVTIDWTHMDGSTSVSEIQFPSKRYWSYVVGIGIVVRTWRHIDVDPSFKFCFDDTDRNSFSVNLGFIYKFEE